MNYDDWKESGQYDRCVDCGGWLDTQACSCEPDDYDEPPDEDTSSRLGLEEATVWLAKHTGLSEDAARSMMRAAGGGE